ncbi:MAG: AtpZ/AtpI family protein [Jatrophihabitantaceae bacterium]
MGLSVAAALILGLGLGWLLDSVLGTLPIFLFVGLAVGIAAATAILVNKFRTYLS